MRASRFVVGLAIGVAAVVGGCGSDPEVAAEAAPMVSAEVPTTAAITETITPESTGSEAAGSETITPESTGSESAGSESAGSVPSPAQDGSVPEPDAATSCRGDSSALAQGRTDIRPSGNRSAPGSIDLLAVPTASVELPAVATWVVPIIDEADPCRASWYAVLDDGSAVIVAADGAVRDASPAVAPPETASGAVRSAYQMLDQFGDPLPDSRVVSFRRWTVALVEPTDRYGHGVLGDRIEAGAVEVLDTESGERTIIRIEAPSVIEGISPMLIDVDQADSSEDATPEVLVTLSNAADGAWLALYDIDGTLRARSEPIGRGNRWRNQLGAGPIGPNGEFEIVDVRTPHLDGVVEFFRVEGDRLARVAATSGYTSHVLGSRNLDLGILVDADADTVLEVVLPTRDLGSLAILERVGPDVAEVGRIDLNGRVSSNIASQELVGQAWLAVGTRDGRLVIFGQ